MLPGKKLAIPEILHMVRRRLWLLLLPPAAGLFAALLVSSRLPNVYESDMLIAIVPQRVPDSFVKTTVTLRTEERLAALETQVTSRTLIERMIQEYSLYQRERTQLPMEDVVETMRHSIEVVPEAPRRGPRGPEPLHAFHVRFRYEDPAMAAKVTQRLGSLFVDQNVRDRGALAEATNEFLETQLVGARSRLEATEQKLQAFRQKHGNELPTQMASNLQVMQSTQMQIQAAVESIARDRNQKLMLERLYKEAEAEPRPRPSGPATAADAAVAAVNPSQQLEALRHTLASLEMRLRPEHPDVVRTKRLVRQLEERVRAGDGAPEAVVSNITPEELTRRERLRSMRAEVDSLDRQIAFKESEEVRLRGTLSEYQRRVEAVPGVESEWLLLTRDYDAEQAAYKDLLQKSEQSKQAVELERRQIGEQFRVLDPAGVPVRPVSPNRLQMSLVGFGAGLLVGVAIGALLEIRDRSFRTEADVLDVLSLPVLAIVPHVATHAERRRQRRNLAFVAASGVLTVGLAAYAVWAMRLWKFVV